MRMAALLPRLIDLARRHGSVITTGDIVRLGGNSDHITRLVRQGVLIRHHPGVFLLAGAQVDHNVKLRLALAAVGAPSAASHQSAAWLQGLLDKPPDEVHVTVDRGLRHLRGVRVHRSTVMPPNRPFRGVPCTHPIRTLVDLAAVAPAGELTDAVDRALFQRLVRLRDLVAWARGPNRGRAGTDALRRVLAERGDVGAPAPSVLESRMARLYKRFGLPEVRAEHVAGPNGEYRVDYAHPGRRVAVELYGYLWHHSPAQMKRDLARQRRLTLQGWKVIGFTWMELQDHPERVAAEIRQALSAGSQAARSPFSA
jgi:hypothetical protein